jgi:hypothetical protein
MDVKLLRSFWTKDIHCYSGKGSLDFKAWVNRGTYEVVAIPRAGEITIKIGDTGPFLDSLAFDIARFACASMETFEGLTEVGKFPKATAWAAVRSYYSAYYAAHAMIRLFGNVFSQLEDGHITILQDYADLYGIGTPLKKSGSYSGQFNSQTNELTLTHKNDSHRDVWKTFVTLIGRLSTDVIEINALPGKKMEVSESLSYLKDALDAQGTYSGGGWLSSYRNNINYRHDYGAWFPYTSQSIRFSDIQKYLRPWKDDMASFNNWLTEHNEKKKFFGVCASVVLLCRLLVEDLESVCKVRANIHRQMVIAFKKRAS